MTYERPKIHVPSYLPREVDDYRQLAEWLSDCRKTDERKWAHHMRVWGKMDLYFLMREILSTRTWPHPEMPTKKLFDDPWWLWLCRVAQFQPPDTLVIVFRGAGKSTVWSLGKTIHRMIENPNMTGAIFSITLDVARPFVEQNKVELETNELLQFLYPDRFFRNPKKESNRWTVDKGFIINRDRVLKDSTLRPIGLLDSTSTGSRISDGFYDDVVNEKVAGMDMEDMTEKCNRRWEMSLNLGFPGARRSYVGTFYAGGDTYHHMLKTGRVTLIHEACYKVNEKKTTRNAVGVPVRINVHRDKPQLFSKAFLENQEALMGPVTFAIQMLGAPASYEVTEFKDEWFRFYRGKPGDVAEGANVVILVDPAARQGSNKHSRTAMVVLALGGNRGIYLLDGVLDRLNLAQRTDALFRLHRHWRPMDVLYEELGHSSDIEHMQYVMDQQNYHFEIMAVKSRDAKDKRIERLIPLFREKRVFFPADGIEYEMKENGQIINIVDWVVENELLPFPNVQHLDFSDAMSRIMEPGYERVWPEEQPEYTGDSWRRAWYEEEDSVPSLSWMAQ